MKKNTIIIFASLGLLLVACNKDEKVITPAAPGNEFITTIVIKAVNQSNLADTVTAIWKDLTPGDATPPTQTDTLKLKINTIYNASIFFLDETQSPIGDITEDILARANYHLVCFQPSLFTAVSSFSITATDLDGNTPALPIGLQNKITTLNADFGNINLQLLHQPNIKDGSCGIGSADVNVDFKVSIQ